MHTEEAQPPPAIQLLPTTGCELWSEIDYQANNQHVMAILLKNDKNINIFNFGLDIFNIFIDNNNVIGGYHGYIKGLLPRL
jgi:hypothetical protein